MIRRHPGETGVCIDHYAGIIWDDDDFSILAMDGKPGSAMEDGTHNTEGKGKPGCWIKKVGEDGYIETTLLPEKGKVADWFHAAKEIVEDPAVEDCRKENPSSSEF